MNFFRKSYYTKGIEGPSLAGNMIMIIVLSVVLISGASLSVFLFATSRNHRNHINQEQAKYVAFLADTLQLPLWNYDVMAVKKIGQTMMEVEKLSFLSVEDAKGNQIFLMGSLGKYRDSMEKHEIKFRDRFVGAFELRLSEDEFLHQQKQWLITGIINTLMVIIGVMLAVTFCVNRFLQKPLWDFSARIKAIADGNYDFNTATDVYRELKDVFDNIQKMSLKIENRQKELIRSNKKLEEEIDKHRITEQLLRESEEKYRSMNDNIPIGFFRIGVDGKIIEYNRFLLNLLNIQSDHDIGQYRAENFYLNPVDRQEMIRKTLHEKEINGFECQIKKGDDKIAWVSISARAVEDDSGNVLYIDGAFEDITEKKVREDKLLQFAKVIEQADEEVLITSPKGIIEYVNPSFEQNTGYSSVEVIGRRPSVLKSGLHDQSFYKELWNTILKNNSWKGMLKNKKKDGSIILHDTTITPITDAKNNISAFVSIRRDITQQKDIERQVYQSQKMQAIGTLAGGIAHDFNNILSGIFGYTQIAQMNIKNQEKTLKCLSNIVSASQRASELVQQILTFSRQTEYKKLPLCVYFEINEALKLIRSSIPVNIKIQNKLISRSLISADPTKIHQIVMNLCTNAYHAMESSGGTLTVLLDDLDILESRQLRNKKMPPGKYLVFTISDTGCGMDAEILEKAFEPYFTTKKVGQGTGLGLSIVQAIVDEHEGFLDVSSSIGEGTQFSLYFPIVERKSRKKRPDVKKTLTLNGSETIMLVDDEKAIRDSYKDFLERHGYQVVVFSDGVDAIEKFRAEPKRFDLVVTDMTMPEKTGSDLVADIRSLDKKIPVIICSGFSNLMDETIARKIGADKYLMKPLQSMDLLTEIRRLLEK
ncbi:putative Histidine kinase [Desulfamplus magnetovallimortis]|uniref:histidine kinase n=1 Tax=Desulfamplus magnetovallimortis TaxID=1246637 RepID=A0A1W1H6B8_9BACT|nr:PAS domain-containing sensor histidine kinase [Desulfamplus magnetovallimortis]SLM28002.1 putative Histidine kinase [Desulfamplus magnetovallimortis]